MRHDLRWAVELSLLNALPMSSKAQNNSRLEKLQLRIQKRTERYLNPMLRTMRTDHNIMLVNVMVQWGKDTGWEGKTKDIGSMVCFLAQMIDESPCKHDWEIVLLLGDIIDHIAAVNKFYPLSVYSGQVASDKWQKLMNKGDV